MALIPAPKSRVGKRSEESEGVVSVCLQFYCYPELMHSCGPLCILEAEPPSAAMEIFKVVPPWSIFVCEGRFGGTHQ